MKVTHPLIFCDPSTALANLEEAYTIAPCAPLDYATFLAVETRFPKKGVPLRTAAEYLAIQAGLEITPPENVEGSRLLTFLGGTHRSFPVHRISLDGRDLMNASGRFFYPTGLSSYEAFLTGHIVDGQHLCADLTEARIRAHCDIDAPFIRDLVESCPCELSSTQADFESLPTQDEMRPTLYLPHHLDFREVWGTSPYSANRQWKFRTSYYFARVIAPHNLVSNPHG